jgi:hypothetical protein
MSYQDYIDSRPWFLRRLKRIITHGGVTDAQALWALEHGVFHPSTLIKCERCQKAVKPWDSNVHHNTYTRKGSESTDDLLVLCRECHEKEHGIKHKGSCEEF